MFSQLAHDAKVLLTRYITWFPCKTPAKSKLPHEMYMQLTVIPSPLTSYITWFPCNYPHQSRRISFSLVVTWWSLRLCPRRFPEHTPISTCLGLVILLKAVQVDGDELCCNQPTTLIHPTTNQLSNQRSLSQLTPLTKGNVY